MQETIVLYPAPGTGHVISMVELGKQLLLQHRYPITILLTTGFLDNPTIDTYINSISNSHPSISFRRLPYVAVDPTPTRSLLAKGFEFVRLNATNVASTLKDISRISTVHAFIIDLFCTSAFSIASAMGIPVYYFFTSGAAVLSAYTYFPKIHDQTSKSFKDLAIELHFPGNPPLKAFHVPHPMLDRDDPVYWDMLYFCSHLPKSNGIIVNTFEELEPFAVRAIAEGLCFPDPEQTSPVYCIGPLITQANVGTNSKYCCLSWLDKQPSRSVVYLCFGSLGTFSVAQLKEIADGLERSGQRFLWVVKKPGTKQVHDDTKGELDLGSVLPNGFLERTKERGMVVSSWAPQVEVLSRESVGGFVTHCGWNSVLEGVVAGVPMIAWPLYAEQHLNRNALVEEMEMAIGLEEREGDGLVSGEELERRVKELMESEKGKQMRERSLKMRELAKGAIGEFGSSTRALAKLVETWNQ